MTLMISGADSLALCQATDHYMDQFVLNRPSNLRTRKHIRGGGCEVTGCFMQVQQAGHQVWRWAELG